LLAIALSAATGHSFAAPPAPPPALCDPFTVFFDSGKTDLSRDAFLVISEAVAVVRQRQGLASIMGYADRLEGDGQALSERRATVVKQEMVRQGINANGIETIGKGSSQQLDINRPGVPEGLNRRAEIWQCPN